MRTIEERRAQILDAMPPDIRDRVGEKELAFPVLKKFSMLPTPRQRWILGEIADGDYDCLSEAMAGEPGSFPIPPSEAIPPLPQNPSPDTDGYYHKVILRVGDLKKALDALNSVSPSYLHARAIKSAGNIEDNAKTWKAEAK